MDEDIKNLIVALKDLVVQLKDQTTLDGVIESRPIGVEENEAFQRAFEDRDKQKQEDKNRQELIDGITDAVDTDDNIADPQRKILKELLNVNVMNFDKNALKQLSGVLNRPLADDLQQNIQQENEIGALGMLASLGGVLGLGMLDKNLITLGGVIQKLGQVTKTWRAQKIDNVLKRIKGFSLVRWLKLNYLRMIRELNKSFKIKDLGKLSGLAKLGALPVMSFFKSMFGKSGVFETFKQLVKIIPGAGMLGGFLKGASKMVGKILWPITLLFAAFDFMDGFQKGFDESGILKGLHSGLSNMVAGFVGGLLDAVKSIVSTIVGLFSEDAEKWLDSFSFKDIINNWYEAIWNIQVGAMDMFLDLFRSQDEIYDRKRAAMQAELNKTATEQMLGSVLGDDGVKQVLRKQREQRDETADKRADTVQENRASLANMLVKFSPKGTEEEQKLQLQQELNEAVTKGNVDRDYLTAMEGDAGSNDNMLEKLLSFSDQLKKAGADADDKSVKKRGGHRADKNIGAVPFAFDYTTGAAKSFSDWAGSVGNLQVSTRENEELTHVVRSELERSDTFANLITDEQRSVLNKVKEKIENVSTQDDIVNAETFKNMFTNEERAVFENTTNKIEDQIKTIEDKIKLSSTTTEEKKILNILKTSYEELLPIREMKQQVIAGQQKARSELAVQKSEIVEQVRIAQLGIEKNKDNTSTAADRLREVNNQIITTGKEKIDELTPKIEKLGIEPAVDAAFLDIQPRKKQPPAKMTMSDVTEVASRDTTNVLRESVVDVSELTDEEYKQYKIEQRTRQVEQATLLVNSMSNIREAVKNAMKSDRGASSMNDIQPAPVVEIDKSQSSTGDLPTDPDTSKVDQSPSVQPPVESPELKPKPEITPATPEKSSSLSEFFSQPVSYNNYSDAASDVRNSRMSNLHQYGDNIQHGDISSTSSVINNKNQSLAQKTDKNLLILGDKLDRLIKLQEKSNEQNELLVANSDKETDTDVASSVTTSNVTTNNYMNGESSIVKFRNNVLKGLV